MLAVRDWHSSCVASWQSTSLHSANPEIPVSPQDVFPRSGGHRGDGTVPSGRREKGSLGRGDVFVVDEDTDLAAPFFQGGPLTSPWKPPSPGAVGGQACKPESSSKHSEENITTDKKDSEPGGRGGAARFPGKPSEDVIIDLDAGSGAKKPSPGFPLEKTTVDPDDPDSNRLREEAEVEVGVKHKPSQSPPPPSSEPPVKSEVGTPSGHSPRQPDSTVKGGLVPPGQEHPRTVTIVSREGDLVLGSDGRKYLLRRGPPGRMGPPGLEVCVTPPSCPVWFIEKSMIFALDRKSVV